MTEFLISPEALLAELDAVALLDVSSSPNGSREAQAAFEARRIPRAKFLPFEAFFSRPGLPSEGRHPWADPLLVRQRLLSLGLHPEQPIVFCDQGGLNFAGRAFLMTRQAGFTNLRVLDGGFSLWTSLGLPTERGTPADIAKASIHSQTDGTSAALPVLGPTIVGLEEMTKNLQSRQFVDLDARPAARFHAAAPSAVDPLPGRIPGALSRPAGENLGPDGRMKTPAALRAEIDELLTASGVDDPKRIVQSCGSGVAACLNILAFDRAGLVPIDDSRLYAGSWSEWIEHPELPRETD